MDHYSDVIADLVEPTESLRDMSPEVWAGFGHLHRARWPRVLSRPRSRS